MTDAPKAPKPLNADARARMEALNAEAGQYAIWLRTQANAPAQRPWFREADVGASGEMAQGRVAAGQMKAIPHHWKWREISPYLDKIARIASEADIPPVEFADRQQFLLTNPGLGGRLQVASTIRCAVSIYNPGDVARAHLHSPNATRTILSQNGGYTNVEGERCEATRGDLILTPNGTWHDHGNDRGDPIVWIDTLDWPLLEFLDIIWLDEELPHGMGRDNIRAQKTVYEPGHSRRLYGAGGIVPRFVSHQRGIGHNMSPFIHYRGADIREALQGLRGEKGCPWEGLDLAIVNPVTGGPLFPTIGYGAQMLRAGEETRAKRETSSTVYVVMEGRGQTEVAGRTFDWEENDIFVVPNFLWRRHIAKTDAVLYTMSDWPLLEFLDIIWLDEELPHGMGRDNIRAQKTVYEPGHSRRLYGAGGIVPRFVSHQRGIGHNMSPFIHYRGADIREALQGMRGEKGCPWEGLDLAIVNPVTGGPLFPTIGYGAQMLRAGEETRAKRETSSTVYVVMEGRGQTEVAGRTFDWEENDIFVVPNFLWRRHIAKTDAVLYTMSDAPLLEKIGQYRAQGLDAAGKVTQLVA